MNTNVAPVTESYLPTQTGFMVDKVNAIVRANVTARTSQDTPAFER